jgi:hypothetical protein
MGDVQPLKTIRLNDRWREEKVSEQTFTCLFRQDKTTPDWTRLDYTRLDLSTKSGVTH